MKTDIRVCEASVAFLEERLRTPLVLASGTIEKVTRARVEVDVEARDGRRSRGAGEMLLSDAWGFPSAILSHEARDGVMRRVTEGFASRMVDHSEYDHPIGLFEDVVSSLDTLRIEASTRAKLAETLPRLGALVCASASDLAVHDAFGRLLGRSSYAALGREFGADLGRWLGPEFAGQFLDELLPAKPPQSLPVIHLVGGADKLSAGEKSESDPNDGLPVTLEEWIDRDGVFQFKVKLKGSDLDWDLARILAVHRVASSRLATEPVLTVDPNEQCASPAYGVELLMRLREAGPEAFQALVLFEQPTERDLGRSRHDQRALSALRPVLIDEGLTDPADLELAVELGWSGVAYKVCKGLSSSLLVFARAKRLNLTGTVMDLTLPGTAFVHSAGFAAQVESQYGVEANARQYLPAACAEVQARMPGLFRVRDGFIRTEDLTPLGLGVPG
jgi:L-alanine-DL-glutamate epimerase-like enolase superfamily enzyme